MDMNKSSLLIDSTPSETYIIGAILNEPSLMDELYSEIDEQMFYNADMRELWQALCKLYENDEPIDITSLVTLARDAIERIGTKRLFAIQQTFIGASEAFWHKNKLREQFTRRQILNGIAELTSIVPDMSMNVDELKGNFERVLLRLDEVRTGNGLKFGTEQSVEWLDNLQKRYENPNSTFGMMTGWTDIDQMTLGWQRQDIVVVGGRTSVGKTAFAIENMIRVMNRGYKVGMFSLEMSKDQVYNRIAGNLSSVKLSAIRTGRMTKEEFSKVSNQHVTIREIAIDDTRGVSADYIGAEMKRMKRTRGLDFVIVDYLQEINEPWQKNDNPGSSLGRVTRKLRKYAQECDCCVMALSQLTREADGKKPQNKDLYGSSGIESAADVIVLLNRDKEESPKVLEANISKQRNGETGLANLYYDLVTQRIEGLSKEVH